MVYESSGVGIMWHVDSMVSGSCGLWIRVRASVRARCLDSSGEWGVSFCRLLFHFVQKSLLYYFKFTVLLNSLLKSKVHPE